MCYVLWYQAQSYTHSHESHKKQQRESSTKSWSNQVKKVRLTSRVYSVNVKTTDFKRVLMSVAYHVSTVALLVDSVSPKYVTLATPHNTTLLTGERGWTALTGERGWTVLTGERGWTALQTVFLCFFLSVNPRVFLFLLLPLTRLTGVKLLHRSYLRLLQPHHAQGPVFNGRKKKGGGEEERRRKKKNPLWRYK